jgi:hypothetical protein
MPFDFQMFKIVTSAKANPAKRETFAIQTWGKNPEKTHSTMELNSGYSLNETLLFI